MCFRAKVRKLWPLWFLAGLWLCIGLQVSAQQSFYKVRIGGKFGYIDKQGKLVIKPAFDDARKFRDGLAPVNVGDKWGYIDKSGKTVIQPQFEDAQSFESGLAEVQSGGGSGYIDQTGAWVWKPTK
jgi:WG containing repeat